MGDIAERCQFFTKDCLCSIYKGRDHHFYKEKHSECNLEKEYYAECAKFQEAINTIPNLLAGFNF